MNMIEAPKGRYRVEEHGGRLIVIDTHTGVIGSSSVALAADAAAGNAQSINGIRSQAKTPSPLAASDAAPSASASITAGAPKVDDPLQQIAAHWLGNARDGAGRLILAPRGRTPVALDENQVRKLALPLLAMAAVPVAVLFLMIFFGYYFPIIFGVFILIRLWNDWYVKTRNALIADGGAPV